jgi:hypothetical protein
VTLRHVRWHKRTSAHRCRLHHSRAGRRLGSSYSRAQMLGPSGSASAAETATAWTPSRVCTPHKGDADTLSSRDLLTTSTPILGSRALPPVGIADSKWRKPTRAKWTMQVAHVMATGRPHKYKCEPVQCRGHGCVVSGACTTWQCGKARPSDLTTTAHPHTTRNSPGPTMGEPNVHQRKRAPTCTTRGVLTVSSMPGTKGTGNTGATVTDELHLPQTTVPIKCLIQT